MKPTKKRDGRVPKPKNAEQALAQALAQCQPTPDDQRPVLLFVAGPNGAGKSTIFERLQQEVGPVDFINADLIAKVFATVPASSEFAQKIADMMRDHYLLHPKSFATESVFSDAVGAKLSYLVRAEAAGFKVVFVYVAIPSPAWSKARVAARVANGGHPVPEEKLERRFHASLANCTNALRFVETGILLENTYDLDDTPFRPMAVTSKGRITYRADNIPSYLTPVIPDEPTPTATGKPTKSPKPPGK